MKSYNTKTNRLGSALIMAVVLTTLLSIVGVMFVMVSRLDKLATSAVSDSKALNYGIESIIEIIGAELIKDTPGIDPNEEYYDYPDSNNAFLASIVPDVNGSDYEWRQISDVTGFLRNNNYGCENINVDVDPDSNPDVVKEYPVIEFKPDGITPKDSMEANANADADGDGIADSKWIMLKDIRSSKGVPFYAAVRVIDNSAMININTAHTFDTQSGEREYIDGSSQMQINLAGLLNDNDSINDLHSARGTTSSWGAYENNVIWNYGIPSGGYLPFDISDELELRYRYCINSDTLTRFEDNLPDTTLANNDIAQLYDGSTDSNLSNWQTRVVNNDTADANYPIPLLKRHLLTTVNYDRIIDPNGRRKISLRNLQSGDTAQELYDRLETSIYPNDTLKRHLAQISANIIDGEDNDSNLSVVKTGLGGNDEFYYGFERPYIYISEITRNFQMSADPCDPNVYKSYAIEIYKHFEANDKFDPWQLEISASDSNDNNVGITINITDSAYNYRSITNGENYSSGGEYMVFIFEDPCAVMSHLVDFSDSPENGANGVDPDIVLRWGNMFMGYDVNLPADVNDSNIVWSNKYDVYFSDVRSDVNDGVPGALVVDNEGVYSYKPSDDFTILTPKTYYWRVDGRNDIAPDSALDYRKGPVMEFTTWANEPNVVYDRINLGELVFDANTAIRLIRFTEDNDRVEVDRWPYNGDPNGLWSESGLGIASCQRNLRRRYILKRFWSPVIFGHSLGHGNSYDYTQVGATDYNEPIYPYYSDGGNYFDNIGDIWRVFKKSAYLENNSGDRINFDDSEANTRINLYNPNMQKIFQYVTLMDPNEHISGNSDETRIKGRININTAPLSVIKQIPWIDDTLRNRDELAYSIVAFRDKRGIPDITEPDYSAATGRYDRTGINGIYESLGFESIGQLTGVIDNSSDKKYDMRYYGIDGRPQYGYPDLTFGSWSWNDGIDDDLEEDHLVFSRLSDLVTVRSDVFTAYILVRLGKDGPQKRAVAILDRSETTPDNKKIKVLAYQLIPDPR